MDIAKLSLTIDGNPAVDQIALVHAALGALPAQATAAANQVSVALKGIATAAAAASTATASVSAANQQAAGSSATFSNALLGIQRLLSQNNALLQQSVISTNSLNYATALYAQQARSSGGASRQAMEAANGFQMIAEKLILTLGAFASLEFLKSAAEARMAFDRLEIGLKGVLPAGRDVNDEMALLFATADRLGMSARQMIPEYVKIAAAFSTAGYTAQQSHKIFTDVAEITKALGLSTATTNRILYDFQEMASLGTVQMRQLRQVIMQVPGGMVLAAEAMGVTTEKFHHMVAAGDVMADEFIPKFTNALSNRFSGALKEAGNTLESETNRMITQWDKFKATVGEAPSFKWVVKLAQDVVGGANQKMENNAIRATFENLSDAEFRVKLQQMFPNAKPLNVNAAASPEYYNRQTYTTPMDEYGRGGDTVTSEKLKDRAEIYQIAELAQQAWKDKWQAWVDRVEGPFTTVAKKEREWTDHQNAARDTLQDSAIKLRHDSLTGIERELAQVDYNMQKQLERDLRARAAFNPELDKEKLKHLPSPLEIVENIDAASIAAKRNIIDKDNAKREAEAEKQRMGDLADIKRINTYEGGRGQAVEIARVNHLYEERSEILFKIARNDEEVSQNAEEAERNLDRWRTDELAKIQEKYARHYVGEGNVQALMQRRKELERELLEIHQDDPQGSERIQKIQREVRDINQTITLQFKTDSVAMGDALSYGFQSVIEQWGTKSEQMKTLGSGIAQSLESNFTNAFTSMLLMQKSVSAGFHEMANSIISDIARIIVQQSISMPIARAIMGAFGGAAGGAAGADGPTWTYEGNHRGGVVGMGGDTRTATMASFAFAPRYHGGGVVGDEMPIVARKGEVVFTPEQMSALGKAIGGGGQKQTKVEILNAYDETEVDRRIAANPNIVLNVIGRNANQIRRMLV